MPIFEKVRMDVMIMIVIFINSQTLVMRTDNKHLKPAVLPITLVK